jgi:hypothetical protein
MDSDIQKPCKKCRNAILTALAVFFATVGCSIWVLASYGK